MSSALDLFLKSWAQPATRVEGGKQAFRDGRLFIADPLDMAKTPITATTPTGVFPVVVYQRMWTHHPLHPKKLTNAFLAVEFLAKPPVRWEQVESETAAIIDRNEFSAEFGNMAIMDGETRTKLLARCKAVPNAYDDFLIAHMEDKEGVSVRVYDVPLGDSFSFVGCMSGRSNGTYEAVLGRDAAGEPAVLAVDFGIMDA